MSVPRSSDQKQHERGPFAQETNYDDFRDHLATADRTGKRRWIYAKKPTGRFYKARTYLSWLLLAVMFVGPFIRINGNPLLLMNIIEGRFSIVGQIFWPQDMAIFAIAMLLFLTSIIIFTTAFGRLWCGWVCPHTILMEMVFRKVEYLIEGDYNAQKKLNAAPWSRTKVAKKATKHLVFAVLAFLVANTLLSYVIGSERVLAAAQHSPLQHWGEWIFVMLFTFLIYTIFMRFREQACTFICPYGRLQSTVLDENSLVIAYDYKRGEKRGPLQRAESFDLRRNNGLGDCVNCFQCVAVCPTGIDIRNGTQMECVNCTACIDACDNVMDRIGRPRGLIRYASLNSIECGQKFRVTTRMMLYSGVLFVLATVLGILVFTRSAVETTFLRAPGALFQKTSDGKIENIYLLKLVNKTTREIPVDLKLENIEGKLKVMGQGKLIVPKQDLATTSVLIELEPKVLHEANTKLKVGVYSDGKLLQTVNTTFIGPRELNHHKEQYEEH